MAGKGTTDDGMLAEWELPDSYESSVMAPSEFEESSVKTMPSELESLDSIMKRLQEGNLTDEEFLVLLASVTKEYNDAKATKDSEAMKQVAQKMQTLKTMCKARKNLKVKHLPDRSKKRLEARRIMREITTIREDHMKELAVAVRESQQVDFTFLFDATGSMYPWIKAVRLQIREIIKEVKALNPCCETRWAAVAYRDPVDCKSDVHDTFDFNNDVEAFEHFMSFVTADGGGDTCEDVAGGLREVLKLNWKQRVRVVFHIGDAPAHGFVYHPDTPSARGFDNHPDGDHGIPELLLQLKEQGIQYHFLKLNDSTNAMVKQMNLDVAQLIGDKDGASSAAEPEYITTCNLEAASPDQLRQYASGSLMGSMDSVRFEVFSHASIEPRLKRMHHKSAMSKYNSAMHESSLRGLLTGSTNPDDLGAGLYFSADAWKHKAKGVKPQVSKVPCVIDKNPPDDWSTVKQLSATFFCNDMLNYSDLVEPARIRHPMSYSTMHRWAVSDIKFYETTCDTPAVLKDKTSEKLQADNRGEFDIKVVQSAFAEGSLRYARYGQLYSENWTDGHAGWGNVCFKDFKYEDNQHGAELTKDDYLQQLEALTITRALAKQYNAQRRSGRGMAKISFAWNWVAVAADASSKGGVKCYFVEPLLTPEQGYSEWAKFCNPRGQWYPESFVDGAPDPSLLEFMLFTHQATRGYMMVTDLQGVRTADGSYYLTDPVLLCKDVGRRWRCNASMGLPDGEEFIKINKEACEAHLKQIHRSKSAATYGGLYGRMPSGSAYYDCSYSHLPWPPLAGSDDEASADRSENGMDTESELSFKQLCIGMYVRVSSHLEEVTKACEAMAPGASKTVAANGVLSHEEKRNVGTAVGKEFRVKAVDLTCRAAWLTTLRPEQALVKLPFTALRKSLIEPPRDGKAIAYNALHLGMEVQLVDGMQQLIDAYQPLFGRIVKHALAQDSTKITRKINLPESWKSMDDKAVEKAIDMSWDNFSQSELSDLVLVLGQKMVVKQIHKDDLGETVDLSPVSLDILPALGSSLALRLAILVCDDDKDTVEGCLPRIPLAAIRGLAPVLPATLPIPEGESEAAEDSPTESEAAEDSPTESEAEEASPTESEAYAAVELV